MDEYFITKKVVEIILENINDHFVKCLVSLSIRERYADDSKVIIGIIELLKTYMETRRNDILSSCIKYTNKGYYLQLTDNLFRLIQSHLTVAKQFNQTTRYVFISDLIDKYNHPVISMTSSTSTITREYKDDITRNRFNSQYIGDGSDVGGGVGFEAYEADASHVSHTSQASPASQSSHTKDAGTLFKEAYNKLKHIKDVKSAKEFELQRMEIKNSNSGNGNSADLM
uniref:Uncharacterized protein n=1 Tax=viral metagenome TaxID=1070528 RepID=A0A6C0LLB1_9ZZZZ